MNTIISHFYNEEYLLPWWLNHHKDMFDHGIMIDYDSTDNSVEIIKSICPKWTIVKSRNRFFQAKDIDSEVEDIEKNVEGWRVCLNTTEFLIGDTSKLGKQNRDSYKIPAMFMVDDEPDTYPDKNISLVKQKRYGIHYNQSFNLRRARNIHCDKNISYPLGRHYESYTSLEFLVLWYGWSPYNESIIKRKLQIQKNIPEIDKANGFGSEHIMSPEKLDITYNNYLIKARDLSEDLRKFNV